MVTMPIVYDQSRDKYVIVDGFPDTIMLRYKNIFERENGMLPVSVIEKTSVIEWHPPFDTTERGKHEVERFTSRNVKIGWDEIKIMKELGMTLGSAAINGLKGIASEILGVPYSIERQIKKWKKILMMK
jgi:hypothetical protein